ncbi:HAD family hydrolase [Mucilaginibacter sp. L3T2-6]|uniref:HAD family hydrolase n=1 Tax=Mucilaginibacter sp. L3T2-6 TaxID=3062491 RepID=UPI002676CE13|nr:HAD family hydrolase [Mucilaginibacter sp. L3T2-6]MDO3642860.1 HAD family hydrolase [Mucilaginibacter sp. L3T2-6]MDV6215185.1 HAD family hydrolase [Mucilaginibacter sp. L3T2-6]
MKKIAFFDFDGTITTKDTLLEVIKHQKGKILFYTGFLLNAPTLIGLKLKMVSNQKAKERMLRYFFSGMNIAAFQQACNKFVDEVLPAMIRMDAIEEIQKLKAEGFEVVVVSASPTNWIQKWTDANGLGLIATNLQYIDKTLSGYIDGVNNNAEEKVARIKAVYNLAEYDEIYCYGDSSGDKPMLALGTKAFYKPFRKK